MIAVYNGIRDYTQHYTFLLTLSSVFVLPGIVYIAKCIGYLEIEPSVPPQIRSFIDHLRCAWIAYSSCSLLELDFPIGRWCKFFPDQQKRARLERLHLGTGID